MECELGCRIAGRPFMPDRSAHGGRRLQPPLSGSGHAIWRRLSRGRNPLSEATMSGLSRCQRSFSRDTPTEGTPVRAGSGRRWSLIDSGPQPRFPLYTTGCSMSFVHADFVGRQRQCIAVPPPLFFGLTPPINRVESGADGDYSHGVGRREIGAQPEPGFAYGGGSAGRRSSGPRSQRIPTPDPSALRLDSV
jgi:hypothetical protein